MTDKVNEDHVGGHDYISPEKFINYSDIVKDYGDIKITHEYILTRGVFIALHIHINYQELGVLQKMPFFI